MDIPPLTGLRERMVYAITECGLTASHLARRLGVTRAAVSHWKTGRNQSLSVELLFPLADATGFSARWLATGKGPPKALPELDPEAAALARRIMDLSTDQQGLLLRLFSAAVPDSRLSQRWAAPNENS